MRSMDPLADDASRFLLGLTRGERLRQTGVLSAEFWFVRWTDFSKTVLEPAQRLRQ
jgi:hypothetical protein